MSAFEGEALTSGFLAEIDAQIEALEALPGVELVQSPTRLELPVRDLLSGMVFQRPLLAWDNDSTLTKDLDRLRQRDDIMGTFVSPSGRAVALTLEHRDGLSKAGCDSLAAAVASGKNTYTRPNRPSSTSTSPAVPWRRRTTSASWNGRSRGS